MIKLTLTYFKLSGKYYSESPYEVDSGLAFHEIVEKVKKLKYESKLPGLASGGGHYYHVLITGADDTPFVPHLILAGN